MSRSLRVVNPWAVHAKLSVQLWTMLTRYARWSDADLLPGQLSLRRTWRAIMVSPAKAFNTRTRLSVKQGMAAVEAPGSTRGVTPLQLWTGLRGIFGLEKKRTNKGRVVNPEVDRLLSLGRGSPLDVALRWEEEVERAALMVAKCFFSADAPGGVEHVFDPTSLTPDPFLGRVLGFQRFRDFVLRGPELTVVSDVPPALPEQYAVGIAADETTAAANDDDGASSAEEEGQQQQQQQQRHVANMMIHIVTRHGLIDLGVSPRTTFLQLQHLVRRKLFWQEHGISGSKLARTGGQLVLPQLCAHFGTIPVEAHPNTPIAALFRDHESLYIGMVEENTEAEEI